MSRSTLRLAGVAVAAIGAMIIGGTALAGRPLVRKKAVRNRKTSTPPETRQSHRWYVTTTSTASAPR